MRSTQLEPPRLLVKNLETVLNIEFRALFTADLLKVNIFELRRVIRDIKKWNFIIDHAELNFICANKLNVMLSGMGTVSNGNAKRSREMIENMQNALELLAKVGVYPELNEVQDAVFTALKGMDSDVPEEIKSTVYSFAEYINLDVARFRKGELVT
jgi:hypothetical protein